MLREHVRGRNTFGATARVLLLAMGFLGRTAGAVSIDMVTVGNPGNAGDTRYAYPPNTPASFGTVDYTYRIGKYEVTAGQYTAFLNSVAGVDAYELYSPVMASSIYGCGIVRTGSGTDAEPYVYSVAPEAANRPVNQVSWGDAARFANWLTNGQPSGAQDLTTTEDGSYYLNGATYNTALQAVTRKADARYVIPTEDEWYKAAYYDPGKPGGAGYWTFPTKSDTAPGRDMYELTNPGNNSNGYGLPYPIDPPYYTTVVGQFHLSASAYGTFDQGGNVEEWNEAIIGSYRVYRGGCFAVSTGYQEAPGRSSYYASSWGETGAIGFRVAEVPEPCSLLFLSAATSIAFVIRRK
ncbi:MAG TPA: SUMF1/EgtB/PvdO family nonheme iron enzyme [Phycisphaerae bacterium]|nr:SUMF1/EgtB/PvdO family nonheme iron enzyme [Phycisphaerae bacterium]